MPEKFKYYGIDDLRRRAFKKVLRTKAMAIRALEKNVTKKTDPLESAHQETVHSVQECVPRA